MNKMGEIRITTGEEIPLPPKEASLRLRRLLGYLFLGTMFVIILGCVIKIPRYTVASGYVSSEHYAEVRSPVTGVVSEILVHSGEQVTAGQVLVRLNSEEEEALLAETRARVSKLKTEIKRREAEMSIDLERRRLNLSEESREHVNQIAIAQLRLQNAQTKLKLTQELVNKGLKAANNLEDDRLTEELAKVILMALKDKDFKIYQQLIDRDSEKYKSEVVALNEELKAVNDSVKRVEARLKTREIRAPIAGVVVRYEFVVGELLQPISVIYEIFGGQKQVLKLRIAERHALKVCVGQKYRARLSSLRGIRRQDFWGDVEYLRNVIQGDGQNTYRVAYCSFDSGKYLIPPGTTVEARVYYGKSSFWFYLFNMDIS
ncbi:MAG: biotin/lipoyl-binding protein [Lentisphaeria bacterium]